MHLILASLAMLYVHVGLISSRTFFDAGSTLSLASLASAGLVALAFIATGRLRRGRRLRWRTLRLALQPRRAALGPSGRADLAFFFLNTFAITALIGWALLSQAVVAGWTRTALAHAFGPSAPQASPAGAILVTAAAFLAYEAAYWVDHWLSHRVPCLWEIHKVHHTAEALSPLTVFRVHPLESLKFYNIVALATGVALGAAGYATGAKSGVTVFGADAAMVAFLFTIGHLQHSHVWITTRGWAGRLLMSPAHHQIHHSSEPGHFGRNLGSALAVFDWLAGTLYIPAERRERLGFGVAGEGATAHSLTGALLTPVARAAAALGSRRAA